MDSKTGTALAELNRAFYTRFAGDFARTRRAWPPGLDLILPHIQDAINIIDLGCGNARLLAFLSGRGWQGSYAGVDSSPGLLEIAAETTRDLAGVQAHFLLVDLLGANWPDLLRSALERAETAEPPTRAIAALAVLHHIPGAAARAHFVLGCAGLLPPGGTLVISTWQFLLAPRLQARILPWSAAGLDDSDVEPGDYLLSWGEGAAGQRYCAHIDQDALVHLAEEAGLEPVDTFYADGHEGNLNLYGIFRKQHG